MTQRDLRGFAFSEQRAGLSNGHSEGIVLPQHAGHLAWVAQTGLALTQCRTASDALDVFAARLGAAPFLLRGYVILAEDDMWRVRRVVSFGKAPALPVALSLSDGLCGAAIARKCVISSSTDGVPLSSWERSLATNASLICTPFTGDAANGVIIAALPDSADDDAEIGACLRAAAALLSATLNRAAECEAQLQQRMQQLDQAHTERLALVGRLTAALAHEINNPLQAIANTLYLLQHRPLSNDKRQRYLGMAQQETERVIISVRRLLDLYRSSGQGKRPVALHRILDQALQQADDLLRERAIDLQREFTSDDPRVSGFAGHLRYACYNLILNAVYAMPRGGRLTVRTYRQFDGAMHQAVVEFADTGVSVDDADLHRLFEPDGPVRGEANGIELPLSYSIVEQHNGTLTAHRSGDEMVFRMTLPAIVP
ncbi:MAG: ATP-binding protein [Roseiflexus sp.]|nr:ATP-binding protein [Roseiflexus sp.]MDW8145592.1 histidine kinase dimerization/phospho-acceptor domain-containing protein [Roseiflexaceae bacterium]MDW8232002.1 histidine kinase dimerization/phospho-acceptor domain-containing protein [Roseiflexaceae bacterium]